MSLTSADHLDHFERDRVDADRQYNDALTALDRAIVGLAAHAQPTRDDLQHLGSLLLVFLQHITAYVDTKNRQAAAATEVRFEAHDRAVEAIAELDARVGILQRVVHMLKRDPQAAPVRADWKPPPVRVDELGGAAATSPRPDDVMYLGFEDRFRGSDEEIRTKLREYLPLFEHASDVVDIGCGRGEFLALLQDQGVSARGVDTNNEMVGVARERGLDVVHADALTFLASLPDESLGGLMASQVVEHFEPAYLARVLDTAFAKLRAGAPVVIETINPACWLAFFSSYIRDVTHVRPIHPETLQYLLQAAGYGRVSIRYSAPVPEGVKMKTIDLHADADASPDPVSAALRHTAHVVNANAAILNNLLFSYLDYAAIGYRP